jgi:hypothetical protein
VGYHHPNKCEHLLSASATQDGFTPRSSVKESELMAVQQRTPCSPLHPSPLPTPFPPPLPSPPRLLPHLLWSHASSRKWCRPSGQERTWARKVDTLAGSRGQRRALGLLLLLLLLLPPWLLLLLLSVVLLLLPLPDGVLSLGESPGVLPASWGSANTRCCAAANTAPTSASASTAAGGSTRAARRNSAAAVTMPGVSAWSRRSGRPRATRRIASRGSAYTADWTPRV